MSKSLNLVSLWFRDIIIANYKSFFKKETLKMFYGRDNKPYSNEVLSDKIIDYLGLPFTDNALQVCSYHSDVYACILIKKLIKDVTLTYDEYMTIRGMGTEVIFTLDKYLFNVLYEADLFTSVHPEITRSIISVAINDSYITNEQFGMYISYAKESTHVSKVILDERISDEEYIKLLKIARAYREYDIHTRKECPIITSEDFIDRIRPTKDSITDVNNR